MGNVGNQDFGSNHTIDIHNSRHTIDAHHSGPVERVAHAIEEFDVKEQSGSIAVVKSTKIRKSTQKQTKKHFHQTFPSSMNDTITHKPQNNPGPHIAASNSTARPWSLPSFHAQMAWCAKPKRARP